MASKYTSNLLLSALGTLLLSLNSANAAVYVATFTGTASGTDGEGIFGQPGAILVNDPFSATFTFDVIGTGIVEQPGLQLISQGSPGPVLDAEITIDGVVVDVPSGSEASFVASYPIGGFAVGISSFTNGAPYRAFSLYAFIDNNLIPYSLTNLGEPYSLSSTYSGSQTQFQVIGTVLAHKTSLVLQNTGLSLSAVPEPATWATFIVGFGIAGAALRKSRHKVKSAAA